MKEMIKISLMALVLAASTVALADEHDGLTCLGKKNAIQTQLDYAKRANNIYQVKGLEKALSEVESYCTNDDLEQKYQAKVQNKLDDVQQREQELQQAKMKGKIDKITKQEFKLKKEQAELKAAQDKLANFHQALQAEK